MGWTTKTPKFSTRTQKAVSGRQLRVIDQAYPTWQFSVSFDVLRDPWDTREGAGLGTGYNELRQLVGLFLDMYGAQGVFAFDDPADNSVLGTGGSPTGTAAGGDGATTTFQLFRQFVGGPGQLSEPIIAPNTVSAVYVNGVDPGGWSVSPTGIVTFGSAPANGTSITWTGTFYFPCHFTDDSIDLQNIMYQIFQLQQLKFESLLP